MDILNSNKNKKKLLLLFLLIIGGGFYMYFGYCNQKEKDIIEVKICQNCPFVAQTHYMIFFNEYIKSGVNNTKATILRDGKNIKTFYKLNKLDKYISFEYDKIMKSDTIKIEISNDIYYVHSFENDYWLGYVPQKCFLNSYKINNKVYVELRESNYGDKYSNSSPSIKVFDLKKEDLIIDNSKLQRRRR